MPVYQPVFGLYGNNGVEMGGITAYFNPIISDFSLQMEFSQENFPGM
jgi:hypothetical protein